MLVAGRLPADQQQIMATQSRVAIGLAKLGTDECDVVKSHAEQAWMPYATAPEGLLQLCNYLLMIAW